MVEAARRKIRTRGKTAMREISFGQYYPATSFVHKMDARIKILLTIAYVTLIFLAKNFYAFLAAGVLLAVIVIFSRVPLRLVLKSIRGILFLVIFTALINVFFYQSGELLWQWKFIKIYRDALIFAAFMALRLTLLVMGTSLLTLTTTPVSLTDGIESLLSPLKKLHFPVHELALIMSIALRFIPTLMEETDRIMRAQKARGADFETGGILHRAKAMLPVLIPLLFSAFRRADELGDAMDARCYSGSKNRTKYKKLRLTWRDPIGVLVVGGALFAVVYLSKLFGGLL